MNEVMNSVNNVIMDNFHKTDNILNDVQTIIEVSQKEAYRSVNTILSQRNWLIGYRIAVEELAGEERAEYGVEIIKNLSRYLTQKYGKGYDRSNLYHCLRFYKAFPQIVDTACRQSDIRLTWSHYRTLLQVNDETARKWYEKEAYEQTWSVRTLQRNIDTQYYYRMLQSQDKKAVEAEMREKTSSYQNDKLEFIKNPVVVEFLGLTLDASFNETKLESSIITNLQKFLMEMGKGYAFVARQQHIHTEKQDYYIDLVFYNYILKCFVLIDLKTERITHQDVGQMDMYIRMYDELKKTPDDNPTLGIVLCSETDEDIARYSILHGNEQLFASKYNRDTKGYFLFATKRCRRSRRRAKCLSVLYFNLRMIWIIRYRRFILQWNCSEGYQDMLMEFTGRHEHANLVRVILSETMTLLLVADCWKICVRCS